MASTAARLRPVGGEADLDRLFAAAPGGSYSTEASFPVPLPVLSTAAREVPAGSPSNNPITWPSKCVILLIGPIGGIGIGLYVEGFINKL